jgi:hypothetical protein
MYGGGTTTVWRIALLLAGSPMVAGVFRNSVGLSVSVLSNCRLPAGSSEYRDLGFDDDEELVRAESLRELFRGVAASCVSTDARFRWRMFRVEPPSLLDDDDPEFVAARPDVTVFEELHDWGRWFSAGRGTWDEVSDGRRVDVDEEEEEEVVGRSLPGSLVGSRVRGSSGGGLYPSIIRVLLVSRDQLAGTEPCLSEAMIRSVSSSRLYIHDSMIHSPKCPKK